MKIKKIGIILLLSWFLIAVAGSGQAKDERESLKELQQSLRVRIENLTQEQDYLLFQKEMYASDSKYLLLNITAKTGQLKYKNRVLKNFPFNVSGRRMRTGILVLSKKNEEKTGRHTLIFGDVLILQWKRTTVPPHEKGIPFLSEETGPSIGLLCCRTGCAGIRPPIAFSLVVVRSGFTVARSVRGKGPVPGRAHSPIARNNLTCDFIVGPFCHFQVDSSLIHGIIAPCVSLLEVKNSTTVRPCSAIRSTGISPLPLPAWQGRRPKRT